MKYIHADKNLNNMARVYVALFALLFFQLFSSSALAVTTCGSSGGPMIAQGSVVVINESTPTYTLTLVCSNNANNVYDNLSVNWSIGGKTYVNNPLTLVTPMVSDIALNGQKQFSITATASTDVDMTVNPPSPKSTSGILAINNNVETPRSVMFLNYNDSDSLAELIVNGSSEDVSMIHKNYQQLEDGSFLPPTQTFDVGLFVYTDKDVLYNITQKAELSLPVTGLTAGATFYPVIVSRDFGNDWGRIDLSGTADNGYIMIRGEVTLTPPGLPHLANAFAIDKYFYNRVRWPRDVYISGPNIVNEDELTAGEYDLTVEWDDDSTSALDTVTWSDDSSFASINNLGALTTESVTVAKGVILTASASINDTFFDYFEIARFEGETLNVAINNNVSILTGVSIFGPIEIGEASGNVYGETALEGYQYGVIPVFDDTDASRPDLQPTTVSWSISGDSGATIDSTGLVQTGSVTEDMLGQVNVTAGYAGNFRSATASFTLKNNLKAVESLSISGRDSINETETAPYALVVDFDDSSNNIMDPATLAANSDVGLVWSVSSIKATINPVTGVLTPINIWGEEAIPVTAVFTYYGETFSITKNVTINDNVKILSDLSIQGEASVGEEVASKYIATATFDDGSTKVIIPVWSDNSSIINIDAGGYFKSPAMLVDHSFSLSASYTYDDITIGSSLTVTVLNNKRILNDVIVNGPDTVSLIDGAQYEATAIYDDGEVVVTPVWSISSADGKNLDAAIDVDGFLLPTKGKLNSRINIVATYDYNGFTFVASKLINLSIGDVNILLTRVSQSSLGDESDGDSFGARLSANSRFSVFSSIAGNLVASDGNMIQDVFVYDRESFSIKRVSIGNDGAESNGVSREADVSNDGRIIVFSSAASNLVSNDSNGLEDIFAYDSATDFIERISLVDQEIEANGLSSEPAISGNGQFVSFTSEANNFVDADVNGYADIFVFDRKNLTIERVSVNSSGIGGNAASSSSALSYDGRYVVYQSQASNLVADDANGQQDIFLYDRQDNLTTLISASSLGSYSNGVSEDPAIDDAGRKIAFASSANNIVANDFNNVKDIFVVDVTDSSIKRVSKSASGVEGNAESMSAVLSADGGSIVFVSNSTNLVENDTNGSADVFWVNLNSSNEISRVSANLNLQESNGANEFPDVSSDGKVVSFVSASNNLVVDLNDRLDVFVKTRELGLLKADVWLEMDNTEFVVGDEITFNAYMDFSDDPTLGGSFDIEFDNSMVSFQGFASNPDLDADPSFQQEPDNLTINLEGTAFGKFEGISGPKLIGSFKFSAIAEGSVTFSLADNMSSLGRFYSASTYTAQTVNYTGITALILDGAGCDSLDTDCDGYLDAVDAFPSDPSEWADTDGDGVGDNSDQFPTDSLEWMDSDGDGVGDNSDQFPADPLEWMDSDGDGIGDNSDEFPDQNPANVLPIANAGVDQSVNAQTTVNISAISSSDSDGTIVIYNWVQINNGTPAVTMTGANMATASFVAPAVIANTDIQFYLTVTDNEGGTANDMVEITVYPVEDFSFSRLQLLLGSNSTLNSRNVRDVDIDDLGNVFVAGRFRGQLDFDSSPGVFEMNAGFSDNPYVHKTNADGTFAWAWRYGDMWGGTATSVVADSQGNVYVAGKVSGTTYNAADRLFIAKLNAEGILQWVYYVYSTSSSSDVSDIMIDNLGRLYVVGNVTAPRNSLFLIRLNAEGELEWRHDISSSSHVYGGKIAIDLTNNIYISGRATAGSINYDLNDRDGDSNLQTRNITGTEDAFVVRLDENGNFSWAWNSEGSYSSVIRHLQVVGDELKLLVTGRGVIDFNNSGAGNSLGTLGVTDNYYVNFLLTGEYISVQPSITGGLMDMDDLGIMTFANDYPVFDTTAMQVTNNGNIYLAGSFNDLTDFDPGVGVVEKTPVGNYDNFILLLSKTPDLYRDSDFDSLSDNMEILLGLNPNDGNDVHSDTDGDGLLNIDEYKIGSDMFVSDNIDLTISSVSNDSAVLPGDSFVISSTVINEGETSVAAGHTVGLYISADDVIDSSDTYLGSWTTSLALVNGTVESNDITVTMPTDIAPGYYFIGAIADNGDSVVEIQETNNTASSSIDVMDNPSVSGIDIMVSSVVVPAVVNAGDYIPLNFVTKNQGDTAFLSTGYGSQWIVYLSSSSEVDEWGIPVGGVQIYGSWWPNNSTFTNDFLPGASETRSESIFIPGNTAPGDYYISPWVQIMDVDMSNNALRYPITVQ